LNDNFFNSKRNQWPFELLYFFYLSESEGYGIVNAEYLPDLNIFVLPYGIMGSPFFELGRPSSMNFGGLGVVTAHETSQ
jgi:hypothetical protein